MNCRNWSSASERGMTMVELLFVVVIGGLVLLVMYEVLITNQRTYAAQNANSQAQQTLHGGMSVLYGELREISPEDGDIISMSASEVHIRSVRGVAIICQLPTTPPPLPVSDPTVIARQVGQFLEAGDSLRVFFDNDPEMSGDDVWRSAEVSQLNVSGIVCPLGGGSAQSLRLDGVTYGPPPDSLLLGAELRAYEHFRYRLDTWSGESYLVRENEQGDVEPLVGPLDPTNGVSFDYLDSDGNTATSAADVAQIDVTLRTSSQVLGPGGEPIGDSLQARIFTRN